MEFKIGQVLTKENYTQAAIYCNKSGDRHIEEKGGKYVIVANPATAEPTAAEKVQTLEAQTGLTRVIRELVLAEGSGASEYTKSKAQEIENMALPLREENKDLL